MTPRTSATQAAVVLPTSCYREYAPPALAEIVLCAWTQEVGVGELPLPHRVLPDACADLIWIDDRPPFVAGPATVAAIALLAPGARVTGIRFRPGFAAHALGLPANELLNQSVPLRELWGRPFDRLQEKLLAKASRRDRVAAIASELCERQLSPRPADRLIAAAIHRLARRPTADVGQLSDELGVSSRHLLRRFTAAVGYSPKIFHRIVRFQRLLALAKHAAPSESGLALIALRAGFADQAHMTREVKDLSGLLPTQLLAKVDTTLSMSDFFKTGPSLRS